MIEDLSKHLTDQEFFTYVKFFDMVVSKNNLADEDLNEINVYKFSIGEDESYRRFRRLFNFIKYQDLPVKISDSRYNKLEEMIGSYANGKDAKEPGKPSKEDLAAISEKIKNGKPVKFSETGMLSWAWFEVYDSTHFLPHQYKISDETKSEVKKNIDAYLENRYSG